MAVDAQYKKIEQSALEIVKDVFGPILNRNVDVNIASIDDANEQGLSLMFPEEPVVVEAPVEGVVEDMQYYFFTQKLAAAITDLMVMGDGTAEFSEESLDGIAEATNQIVGALATHWSDEFGTDIKSAGAEGKVEQLESLDISYEDYVQINYSIDIENWGQDTFAKLVPRNLVRVLADVSEPAMAGGGGGGGGDYMGGGSQPPSQGGGGGGANVQTAQFGEFDEADVFRGEDAPKNLDLLMDISLPVTIELGRTQMLIRDVLELGPGSVIELQKLSGEPVDLYINEKRFALGEVVVIDENFGIRITELLSVEDRIKALR